MKRFAVALTLGLAMLLVAGTSHAVRYTVSMSGPNENPTNASPGIGSGLVDIDTTTHLLSINIVFTGLTGNTTASHIHCCITVPNGTAGVATTTPTFPGFPLGVTSGTYQAVLDMTQASNWNPAFVTANGGTTAGAEAALANGAANGLAYFNIHSSTFGGGEIRGFLILQQNPIVPTLSEWGLIVMAMLLALAAFVVMRRRSR